MDFPVRTSFIPKKTLDPGTRPAARAGAGILFFLAFVIFLGSTVLAGGAFAYDKYLAQSISSKSDQLTKARAAFEPATIQYLQRLDDRLIFGKQILSSHVAPSNIFSLLSASTLATVAYSKLNYDLGPDGKAILSLEGTTKTFSEVALQSDEFNKQRPLHDVIFSNFNVQENGTVVFAVNAAIDPGFLLYRNVLDGTSAVQPASGAGDAAQQQTQQQQQVQTAPATQSQPQTATPPPNLVPSKPTP